LEGWTAQMKSKMNDEYLRMEPEQWNAMEDVNWQFFIIHKAKSKRKAETKVES
jgi:hypothetical protein